MNISIQIRVKWLKNKRLHLWISLGMFASIKMWCHLSLCLSPSSCVCVCLRHDPVLWPWWEEGRRNTFLVGHPGQTHSGCGDDLRHPWHGDVHVSDLPTLTHPLNIFIDFCSLQCRWVYFTRVSCNEGKDPGTCSELSVLLPFKCFL